MGGDKTAGEDLGEAEKQGSVLYGPEEKFANPRDHMGRTATEVRSLCGKTADCKCPECDHPLVVRAGDKVATHFAHARGRKDTSCKGGFETPWHKCAKRAAGMREGWLDEVTDKRDRHNRFDAYNQFTQEAFEAVHSLSETYIEKQQSLASIGVDCKWLFDSAGDFANKNSLPLDIDKATGGLLECYDLLSKKAISVIEHIGPERCFLHYLGLAWKWVGVDRWQACSPASDMQKLCTGERGINRLLIDLRARGDMPKDKLAFRNGELVSTAWQEISPPKILQVVNEQKEQLLERWIRIKRSREYSRRKKSRRQFRPSTAHDIASRALPVCEIIARRQRLTEQLEAVVIDEPAGPASPAPSIYAEDPLARIHREWRENCRRNGWLDREHSNGR